MGIAMPLPVFAIRCPCSQYTLETCYHICRLVRIWEYWWIFFRCYKVRIFQYKIKLLTYFSLQSFCPHSLALCLTHLFYAHHHVSLLPRTPHRLPRRLWNQSRMPSSMVLQLFHAHSKSAASRQVQVDLFQGIRVSVSFLIYMFSLTFISQLMTGIRLRSHQL